MADFLELLPTWIVFGWLATTAVRQRRHIRSLRSQLAPVPDVWEIRCQGCGRLLREGPVLICEEKALSPDGTALERMRIRAWHSDRPKCSAAFATDPRVMDAYLNGEPE